MCENSVHARIETFCYSERTYKKYIIFSTFFPTFSKFFTFWNCICWPFVTILWWRFAIDLKVLVPLQTPGATVPVLSLTWPPDQHWRPSPSLPGSPKQPWRPPQTLTTLRSHNSTAASTHASNSLTRSSTMTTARPVSLSAHASKPSQVILVLYNLQSCF